MAAVEYLPDKQMSHQQQPTGANCSNNKAGSLTMPSSVDHAAASPPPSRDVSTPNDDDSAAATTMHNKRKRLDGKVAIVTGGAQGIGEAIVRAFVEHGARVVIADAAGRALASSLGGPGQACSYEHCDVSVEADVERTVRGAVARYGRLDVLCNNAGVQGRQEQQQAAKSILSLDAVELERVLRVAARRAGSIVSVASVAGVMGGMGTHAYTASMHALVGLTKNAACELGAHGIRVNCISPCFFTPMLLKGVEEDAEDETLLRASDESRYVSGHNLVVDGGITTARNVIGL